MFFFVNTLFHDVMVTYVYGFIEFYLYLNSSWPTRNKTRRVSRTKYFWRSLQKVSCQEWKLGWNIGFELKTEGVIDLTREESLEITVHVSIMLNDMKVSRPLKSAERGWMRYKQMMDKMSCTVSLKSSKSKKYEPSRKWKVGKSKADLCSDSWIRSQGVPYKTDRTAECKDLIPS